MVEVGIGRIFVASPPAFRQTVFTVHAAPAVGNIALDVGIHIPPSAVVAHIRIFEALCKQPGIAVCGVVLDDFMQPCFQITVLQSVNTVVISARYFGKNCRRRQQNHCQQSQFAQHFFHVHLTVVFRFLLSSITPQNRRHSLQI